jgi:hypothetical protein
LASKKGFEPYKQNYNFVFKSSIDLFKGKSLDFFGIDGARKVTGILDMDQPVTFNQTDKALICDDNLSIHMEEESDISKADLKRFLFSHCWYLHHGRHDNVITVIVTNKKPRSSVFEDMSVSFHPLVVNLSDRDFEEAFDRLERHIDAGEEFNELELVYSPLYKSSKGLNVEDKLRMTTDLVRRAKAGKHPSAEKIFALTVVLCGKFIPKATYNELWEELTVRFEDVPIIQVAEAIGAKKGKIALADALALYGQGFSEDEIASKTGLDIGEVKEQVRIAKEIGDNVKEKILRAKELAKQGLGDDEIALETGLAVNDVQLFAR